MKRYQVWYRYIDDAIACEEFDTLKEAQAYSPFRTELIAITELIQDLGG